MEISKMDAEKYIKALEATSSLSEPAIKKAIKALNIPEGSKILDIPCGIGNHMYWMLNENPKVHITGVDIADEHVEYARNKLVNAGKDQLCELQTGDMNRLNFENDIFDLIWCCDGLWPGPKDMGCPAEEPYDILNDMARITRPGRMIAILFWSSQRLLPGYPLIEAALNATKSANMPTQSDTNPELHMMRAKAWLQKTGLKNIQVKTFAADVQAPLNEKQKEGLITLFNMFWGRAENEVSKEVWDKYTSLASPESNEFILNNDTYAAILTYTMFTGEVNK
jgi:demethylmenaquinone methyltransferase/2-methoxy-6-polyprenyl-1,4-benzoquinol methylase